ncbi:Lrp/AsnC family transcriptional regulator [Streptomyces sp. VRA16 Mangrove soil]|uniref:Lrp/AsnC family transcriptional regulator n=1 Tax=Streptomyces sp. VRA16 Mangrove soil TaxID=2817434 RepID=UPI001A9EB5F3|nr:Lrp/AsnC family transcriptional regulator [Streptomyces sp. VRA16 Mangrove soil]MBO1332202.1 Lrp/AsnC family transcriptional regulator [Streptomyces sp. VRA16 Mangrove soil]
MSETVTVSELDLALVNALQLRPRASWTELASPLGVTASTLARRWERLTELGLAWVYAAPGREFSRTRCTAFVLLRCRPGSRADLADRLCAFDEVVTVELTGPGSADLLLDVLASDLPALTRFLTARLEPLPGLVSVDCLFATSLFVEGSRWRLRSLAPTQLTALGTAGAGAPEPTPTLELDAVDRALLDALVRDGRLGLAALAERSASSPATVRRRLRRLTDSGVLTFRCDMATELAGRPLPVSLLGRAPARDIPTVHRTLAALPECRLVAAVTGTANIFTTLWVHDLGDVQRREAALCARLPTLTVTDRIVGLHTVKRMGHLLDADGRRTGVRPIRPW